MKLRKHQKKMATVIDNIICNGAKTRTIIAQVTPGGGKSLLPVIAGRLITAGLADALCWIVPRKTLQYQGEMTFQDPLFRQALNHNLSIRSSTNEYNPCRGLNGFTTTYQAVASDKSGTISAEISSKRYILVLDEYHHAEIDSLWHEALQVIEKKAQYVLLMTGTLERGNGAKIAFTDYKDIGSISIPVLEQTQNTHIIRYSRQDALAEQAIIPLTFLLNDGSATWQDMSGEKVQYDSISNTPKKDVGAAIYTAVSTEYADDLLLKGYNHWREYQQTVYSGARMLVVTAGIKQAMKAVEFFKKRFLNVEICTSHDSKQAGQSIRNLQAGKTSVLVGIAMFYEGFDCKPVTHIIALTHIRSMPWLEQMLARAVRVDPHAGHYALQCGHIFAPDDILFRTVVEKIQKEQQPFAKNRASVEQMDMFGGCGEQFKSEAQDNENIYNIKPLRSTLTSSRLLEIDERQKIAEGSTKQAMAMAPSDIERELREKIEKHIRKYSFNNRYRPQKINTAVKNHFGIPRDKMTIDDLENTLNYIETEYPLSFIRGYGHRVPTRARIV